MTPLTSMLNLLFFGIMTALYLKFRGTLVGTRSIPGILTTLGILGTFVGIFIGLWRFDPNNIQGSIPILLAGLKTAFLTSIIGVIFSLAIKAEDIYKRLNAPAEEKHIGATIDTLAEILNKIQVTQTDVWSKAEKQLDGIEKSLVGDGDTTLLTQLQKLRTSFVDKQDELVKEFRDFAKTMAENNSKALIEALNEVIRDFNAKINEQFGENFKQLNAAVGKILEWQEKYRQQIAEMTDQFERTVLVIDEIKTSIITIADRSKSLVTTSESLRPILIALDEKQKDIAKHLEAFAKIADDARSVIPTINAHLKESTDKIAKSLTDTSETVKQTVTVNLESIRSQSKHMTETASQVNAIIDKSMARVSDNIHKLVEENSKLIKEQIKLLDKTLEEELTKSLQTLGAQLTTLSNRFVQDYTPLTERLREIIQLTKKVG